MKQSFFNNQSDENKKMYIDLLKMTASLSNLYADSEVPFVFYRAMENVFCRAFSADNLSRSDVSADAGKDGIGIGLKTFLHSNGNTFQKIAEFNKESYLLKGMSGLALVKKVSEMRNQRIESTKSICGLDSMMYHLLTRSNGFMTIYEEPMDLIHIEEIKVTNLKETTIHFTDELNEYCFNISKSTLMKRFVTSEDKKIIEFKVDILDDPYEYLLSINMNNLGHTFHQSIQPNEAFIILPLYSERSNRVEIKSGLNQWNAGGRKRNQDEVYIPIPSWIHKKFNTFFSYNTPDHKTTNFEVELPNSKKLSMKVAQSQGKALMSNPNSALGNWILRDILKIKEGTIVTKNMLDIIGVDSVKLTKLSTDKYRLDFLKVGSYEDFKQENDDF